MLCDECGKNPASIKMVTVVAGERRELNLCPECAAKRRIPPKSIGMGQLLAAVLNAPRTTPISLVRSTITLTSLEASIMAVTLLQFAPTSIILPTSPSAHTTLMSFFMPLLRPAFIVNVSNHTPWLLPVTTAVT